MGQFFLGHPIFTKQMAKKHEKNLVFDAAIDMILGVPEKIVP